MDDLYERYEIDFEIPETLLDRLKGLERGAKVSGRIPTVTARDRKNGVVMCVFFGRDVKKVEQKVSRSTFEDYLCWLLSRKNT